MDAFGHPVSLNIGDRGAKHRTLCGGTMTCFATLVFTAYLVFQSIAVERGDVDTLTVTPFIPDEAL